MPSPVDRVQMLRLNPVSVAQLQAAAPCPPLRLLLNLSSNETYPALLDRHERPTAERATWRGTVEGRADSHVILALSRGALAGSVLVPGRGSFQIQHAGEGWQRLTEIDPSRVPPCAVEPSGGRLINEDRSAAQAPAGGFVAAADASTNTAIDLLVVYTAAAREGAGGVDGMNALIDVAVAEANDAFGSSQVQARLRLVHQAEIDYEETGDINEDLDRLEEDDDEEDSIPAVHALRSQHQADLVCLITETTGGPLGLANVMHELDVEFSEEAFSVVQRQFANAYYVLAHEIGHNLGCQHDRLSSSGHGCFDYSHAHHFTVEGLRYHTVMAYQPGLPTPHFSNPDVSFLGVPTGVPEGATNSANNAKTINLTALTASRFSSVLRTGTPPQLVLVFPTNGAVLEAGQMIFTAEATDADGVVVEVEFYLDGTALGESHEPPFRLSWAELQPGPHRAYAVAKDTAGWRIRSPQVTFAVIPALQAFDFTGLAVLPDGRFRVRARGPGGRSFRLETSANLIDWAPLTTNVFSTGSLDLFDAFHEDLPSRFYRIQILP